MEAFAIDPGLAREVCDQLGVDVPASVDDVDALYRAWTARVPFDPVAKMAAVRRGRTPPGDDPSVLPRRWLATGLGATCWGHCSALAAICGLTGTRCTVGLDRMLTEAKIDFHSFTVVHDGARRWALDPVHPSGAPLPLEPGAVGDHGVYEVGIDEVGGRTEHWFSHPGSTHGRIAYVVLGTELDRADVRAFCAVSARFSGVRGGRLHARWCPPGELHQVRLDDDGVARSRVWRADGSEATTDLADADAALAAIGYHGAAVDQVVTAGLARRGRSGTLHLIEASA